MIIAEIGSIHDGSLGNAKKLVKLAANCGADAVKFQTHIAEHETLKEAPNPRYFNEESRFDYFERTSFSLNEWAEIKKEADKNNIIFLSSPFSIEAVEILKKLDTQIYKIPSGEITNLPLLEKIASIGKPVFLSSGMSNWNELDIAVNLLKKTCKLTIMQCSSLYPCPPEKVGLNIIQEIKDRYNTNVGFSDHTLGFSAPIAAAALGATVVEKHLTFSRQMYGSDAKHSMEPDDFKILSHSLKEVWKMLMNPINKDNDSEYKKREIFSKKYCNEYFLEKEL